MLYIFWFLLIIVVLHFLLQLFLEFLQIIEDKILFRSKQAPKTRLPSADQFTGRAMNEYYVDSHLGCGLKTFECLSKSFAYFRELAGPCRGMRDWLVPVSVDSWHATDNSQTDRQTDSTWQNRSREPHASFQSNSTVHHRSLPLESQVPTHKKKEYVP